MADQISRFVFEQLPIRGCVVQLNASWNGAVAHAEYPDVVRKLLAESFAAVTLLSTTIKFSGALIMQIQGDGPVRMLVTQATDQHAIRGIARLSDPEIALPEDFRALCGNGRLVLTIEHQDANPYQGIVNLEGDHLSEVLETYFRQSEQLATRLWLKVEDNQVGGLLLQTMPGNEDISASDDWRRVCMLADTLSSHELANLSPEKILTRLFHEDGVRLFDEEPVMFRCTCSREKIERVLATFQQQELEEVIAEQGEVQVNCEFCNRTWSFDTVDIAQLYQPGAMHRTPRAKQ